MSKRFRSWDVDQQWLLPPSIQDFVPEGHPAHFVRELVRGELDLGAILGEYEEERGQPPYDPTMMTALLLYAYTQGVYSSRRIARGCEERVDFMAVTALQRPDFRTVNDFRKRHLKTLGGLFVQVLRLCGEAGLVKLGHVALDGSKIRANASKHKGMSYRRMKKEEERLRAQVRRWFELAEAADVEEDEECGADRRGDELPDWVADKQKRLEKIREAKEALERKARERDAEAVERRKGKAEKGERSRGRPPKRELGKPEDKEQRNFTDPDSRIMKTADGFQQCYNAQAAVDASSQVIVGQALTDSATDRRQLIPLVDAVREGTGKDPKEVSADCDYCSEANLEALEARGIRGYVATGKQQHGQPDPVEDRKTTPGTRTHAMKIRIRRGGYRSRYRLRKQTVEPVFGQIKAARGFRQFLLRGIDKVSQEWALLCTAHNLAKLMAVARA
jgi:transposase